MNAPEIGTAPVDWRGTPIVSGALVIYGAPVGRSIALVEALVADPMLTPRGRIWLDVQRRAYGGWTREGENVRRVHVGADRLTVVEALPPTTVLTEQEKADRESEQRARREVWLAAHHVGRRHTDSTNQNTGYVCCDGDCWEERRRFDAAWEAGRPLDG